MPITVAHALTATTPDDPAYEIKPSNWNETHVVTFSPAASEVIKWASAGAQSISSGTLAFSNSNGVSFGMNAGTITGSHNGLTTAAASNHSHGNPTLALTNLSGTTASNSAGLTLSLSAAAPGAGGGVAVAAGTQTGTSGTIVFANSNGVTFGMSNSSQVTASHNGLTTARASTDGVGLNTAQSNVTWTVNSSGISLDARGYAGTGTSATNASITLNSNGLAISVAAPGAGGAINVSAGTTSNDLTKIVFADSNGVSFGLNGSTVTASVPGRTARFYANHPSGLVNAQTQFPTQSTFYVFPFNLEAPVTAEVMRMISSPTIASTSFASTSNTTFSYQQIASFSWLLYTRGYGASSLSLMSLSSGSQSLRYSINFAFGSASNTTHSMSFGVTYWNSAGNTTSYSTSDTTSGSQIIVRSNNVTRLTGWKAMDMPINALVEDGRYWLMFRHSTTQTTQATNMSGARLVFPIVGVSQINSAIGDFGSANSGSQMVQLGMGSFTTVGGASTSALNFSNISSSASHVIPMVQFGVGLV